MTDRYAVMGNPVAHSKSPQIHARFAAQTEQDLEYTAILVERGGLADAVRDFLAAGGRGLNITVPFKEDAWELVAERSDRAELAGAVNTLVLRADGRHYGDNTDGIGLVRDLTLNHGCPLTGRRILLVGAGGAAQGVIEPLLREHPAELLVANRTPSKALDLARRFRGLGPVAGCGLDEPGDGAFDLVINATAASLAGKVPALPERVVGEATWCYDMMYSDVPTAFVTWARERGAAHAVDGLGMLVEQAAESFFLWREVRPATAPVIAALRAGT